MWNSSYAKAIPYERIAFWSLHFLFLVNVYRAFTQSITCDEAFTYNNFVGTSPLAIFRYYDANNHPLHTYLCCLSVWLFGLSELSLRLPSLVGGGLYFAAIFRLSRHLFGTELYFLFSVWLLAANPYLLEFLSAARGYGLAVAFLAWGFYFVLRSLEATPCEFRYLRNAGYCFGLSFASNLVFILPITAVSLMAGVIVMLRGEGREGQRELFWKLIDSYVGPAAIISFLLLVLPLSRAIPDNFYVGARSLRAMAASLADPALLYHGELRLLPDLTSAFTSFLDAYALAALRLFVFGLLGACIWMWMRRTTAFLPLAIASGAIIITAIEIIVSHKLLHVPYPEGRTETYLLFLLPISALLLGYWLRERGGWLKWTGHAWTAVLALLLCHELLQFDARFYYEWRYDAETKDLIKIVNAREAGSGKTVKIGGSWIFEPALNFYRVMEHYEWLAPVKRGEVKPGFQYYLLTGEDTRFIDTLHLRPISTGAASGTVLAAAQ